MRRVVVRERRVWELLPESALKGGTGEEEVEEEMQSGRRVRRAHTSPAYNRRCPAKHEPAILQGCQSRDT